MSKNVIIRTLGNLTESQTPAVNKSTTIEARKNEWKSVVESFDIDRLLAIQDEMDSFVDKMKVLDKRDSTEIDLTTEEAKSLMVEYLSSKNISEFLEARQSMVREVVFQVIEERLREEGVEDPKNTNGEIVVPELGKAFKKEGAGLKDPSLDVAKLKEILGDRMKEITTVKIIPERRVEEIDEDLLVELAANDPSVMEAIKQAAVPGKPKSARFTVRDTK